MLNLIVRVIGTSESADEESVLASIESDRYDPDHLEECINRVLDSATKYIDAHDESALNIWRPQIVVALTADDEMVRPSLHLSLSTLVRLVNANASLDFDPYV